jgi:hypothetical protein
MRFLTPGWLVLLAAVAALAVAYVVVQRRRGRYAVRFAALPLLERVMPHGPGWRRHVPALDGESVRVPADVDALAGLAAGSGGLAYRAETAAELEAVYADIGSSIGFRTEEREVMTAVLAAALLAAFAATAGSLAWFSRLP